MESTELLLGRVAEELEGSVDVVNLIDRGREALVGLSGRLVDVAGKHLDAGSVEDCLDEGVTSRDVGNANLDDSLGSVVDAVAIKDGPGQGDGISLRSVIRTRDELKERLALLLREELKVSANVHALALGRIHVGKIAEDASKLLIIDNDRELSDKGEGEARSRIDSQRHGGFFVIERFFPFPN